MYKISLVLLIMVWPLLVNGQDKKAAKHNLKSVTEYEQKFEKGSAGKTVIQSETKYDNAGNVIEEIEYKLGKVDKHVTYQYDEDNNKIRETEMDASGKKVKIIEYKYTDGLKTEKTVYNGNNQVISKKTYKYEKN
jgi:hypothetical protein